MTEYRFKQQLCTIPFLKNDLEVFPNGDTSGLFFIIAENWRYYERLAGLRRISEVILNDEYGVNKIAFLIS